ncbi:hypothetical protein MHF_0471 [Mycoplasma haemofelis Ohio2]|uniref:Uncharacterized protein n=1 Tax=Mycoplasma haemofelis (strain Ohio2) TaxID=859194 RepID=F6FHK4_MYCHI|nr:hypothetical protein MHF_0471 [Mycoplasma haemofelis Ohio2]
MTSIVKGLISMGTIGTVVLGGTLVSSVFSSSEKKEDIATSSLPEENVVKISFKEKFLGNPKKVLLNSSGDNHDNVWNIMIEEFKAQWDDAFPFKKEELNLQKLKEYCSSLEGESNPKDFEKFEKHCSRNNFASNYTSTPIPKGSNAWEEAKKNWDNGNFKPASIDSGKIEEWCLNKGKDPFTKKYEGDESSYYEWCLGDKAKQDERSR